MKTDSFGARGTLSTAQGDLVIYQPLIDRLRHEGVFEQRQVLGGYEVLAGDGTQHFCSQQPQLSALFDQNTSKWLGDLSSPDVGGGLGSAGRKNCFSGGC